MTATVILLITLVIEIGLWELHCVHRWHDRDDWLP